MTTITTTPSVVSAKVAVELENAWANVFKIVNHFLTQHDRFGFKLIQEKIDPSIEDLLLSLKFMSSILNLLDDSNSVDMSEQRMLLNAKQQIVLFEQAALALRAGDEAEYSDVVKTLRNQAQF